MARKAQDEGVLNVQTEIMTPPSHGSKFMPSCVLITGSTVRTPPLAKPDTGTEARVNTMPVDDYCSR